MKRARDEHLAALIIAGGRGTRFWPEARTHRPKPLFAPDGKRSLLAETIARVHPAIAVERTFVLVAAEHAAVFRRAIRGIIPPRNLIVEPEGRGTTVAIAYGAAVIAHQLGENTVVAVMPADHHIPEAKQFRETLEEAARLAALPGAVVVVGVTPTRAETGYGYQAIGKPVGAGFRVARFVEKPDAATARRMMRSGKYLWNAGIFVLKVATLLAELKERAPALAAAMARFPKMKPAELRAAYGTFNLDSFDRVVAEKSRDLIGVRARFAWNDVGSWEGLWEALRGEASSVTAGKVVTIDSNGVMARGGRRLMVLIGVSDVVAVDTDDAILIIHRSRSQELGRALDELRRRGHGDYL
jgi:mannose-1-phosphate guanylyltransferase/mannose-6-phosphate isomerase